MPRTFILAIVASTVLASCGDDNEDVVSPEDYVHFSDTFTMSESVSEDMQMDGGGPLIGPEESSTTASILTAEALPGDEIGKMLTAEPDNSPALNTR